MLYLYLAGGVCLLEALKAAYTPTDPWLLVLGMTKALRMTRMIGMYHANQLSLTSLS